MMPFFSKIFAGFLVSVGLAGISASVVGTEIEQAVKYSKCMAVARENPKQGFEEAIAWRDLAGGDAAEHCAAVALIELGMHQDAAQRLEALAQKLRNETVIRAKLFGQAAQAWLLAGSPARAEATATVGLGLRPGDPDLLIDRAQARVALGRHNEALADLNDAISTDLRRPDAYVFRGAVKRFLDDLVDALSDVETALSLDPTHPDALLERGILLRLADDKAGARADWLRVLSSHPDSPAAIAARGNLEKMDVKVR